MERRLTEEQKNEMREEIRTFLAEELEIEPDEISDETNLIDDLGADSILFLEMFEEFSEKYDIRLEVRTIGNYMLKHPVYTFGDTMNAIFPVVEEGDKLIEEFESGD